MRTDRTLRLCVAAMAIFPACVALGQIMAPLAAAPPTGSTDVPKPTPSMEGLFRVTQQKTWNTTFSVEAALFSPRMAEEDANDPHSPVRGATFALPFMTESATHAANPDSVELRLWLSGMAMPASQSWLQTPPGMQRLRGVTIAAPGNSKFDFDRATSNTSDMPYVMRPAYASKREGLFVQMQMKFTSTSRAVVLDVEAAREIGWPKAWPPEAQSTFEKQMFMDQAIDPWTGLAHDIGQLPMDSMAKELLLWGGVVDPKQVKPALLAEGLAAIILPGLPALGHGLIPVCDRFGRNVRSMDPGGNGLPPIRNALMGVDVRDVVSVLRDQYPNQAERALVLASIYRRVGLPARVMVGFEADVDDHLDVQHRLARAPTGELQKGLDSARDAIQKSDEAAQARFKPVEHLDSTMWPDLPPIQWTQIKTGFPRATERPGRFRAGGGRPSGGGGGGGLGGGGEGRGPSGPSLAPRQATPARPAQLPSGGPKIQLSAFERSTSVKERLRFWVEFALYDPDRGLAWVPVDPGAKGFDYHFGSLANGENIVVLGTGFWPSQTILVDHLGDPMRPLQCLKREWPNGVPPEPYWTDSLPAGLWGFWSEPGQAHAHWQQIGFEATQSAKTGAKP